MQLLPDGVAFVTLPVRDPEVARRFYGQLLGLTPLGGGDFDLAGLRLRLAHDPARAGRGTGLTLYIDDVQDAAARMVTFRVGDVRPTPAGDAVTIRDPDGNTIDLLQRPPHPPHPPLTRL